MVRIATKQPPSFQNLDRPYYLVGVSSRSPPGSGPAQSSWSPLPASSLAPARGPHAGARIRGSVSRLLRPPRPALTVLFLCATEKFPLTSRTSRFLSPRTRRYVPKYRCWCNQTGSALRSPDVRPGDRIRSDEAAPHWFGSPGLSPHNPVS